MKPVEKTIDGFKVSTTKHSTVRGLQLRARLMRIVLPAISALTSKGVTSIGAVKDIDLDDEAGLDKLAPALERLAEKLDPEILPDLMCEILCNTSINVPVGEPPTLTRVELNAPEKIDAAFDGRHEFLLYKVLGHALKVNFSDPFAWLAGMASKAAAAKAASPDAPAPILSS